MIYVCYRQGSSGWTEFIVEEFDTERKALNWLRDKAKSRIVGVFDGKRLEPEAGEVKVVKKGITGFGEPKSEK